MPSRLPASSETFDRLARLAARLLGTSVGMVTLVEHDHVRFLGAYGLAEPFSSTRTAPHRASFCFHVAHSAAPLAIEDTAKHYLVRGGHVAPSRAAAYLGLPLTGQDGRVVGAVAVCDNHAREWSDQDQASLDDIRAEVEQRLAWLAQEQRWREDEEKLRLYAAAVEQTTEAILITRAELNEPGPQIVYANPAFTTMSGYTLEELVGKTPRLFQGPKTDMTTLGRVRDALESGRLFTGEATNYRKDGTTYTVEWQIAPIRGADGRVQFWVSTQRDVTARNTAASNLRVSEARFRDLAINSPDFIYIIDVAARKTIFFNRQSFLGYTTEEMERAGSIMSAVHPDDQASMLAHWRQILSSVPGTVNVIEYRLRDKNGNWEWIESRATIPSSTPESTPVQVLITLRVVTERKLAEAALRESEERYRMIAETAMDCILIVDQDSQIKFANRAAESVFGYTPEELQGKPITMLMSSDYHAKHLAGFTRYTATGERQLSSWGAMNMPGFHRDGRTVPLEISLGEVIREGQRLFIAVIRDISARKQMEQELKRSYNMLNTIMEGTTDSIFVKDHDGRYLAINSAGTALFKQPAEALIGRTDGELMGEEPARLTMLRDQAVIESGVPQTFEDTLLIGKEQRIFLTTKSPYRDPSGAVIGLIGIARDITDRKQLEAQFLQAQKMESIGRLAGGVAHDFNNLLTAILGYTDLLLGSKMNIEARGDLEEIQRAAQRATNLTRQLLTFARRQMIEPKSLNLNTLLMDMSKLIRRLIGEDIELVLLPAPDRAIVHADPGQIEQVIINLAVNARDAMPHGGKLIIRLERPHLNELGAAGANVTPGQYVDIQVIDNGFGMNEATKSRVFEPFFTTKAIGKGTGLGLATCYGIVKQHGGHIWLESTEGQGTIVHVIMPLIDYPISSNTPEDTLAIVPRGSETLLLVEDEASVRGLATRVLTRQGYTVLEAANGVDAMRMFQNEQPAIDLLITDLVMPQMGGAVLARELQQHAPNLRVLFISGYSEGGITPAPANGDIHFLQKPFTPQSLALAVRAALDAKQPR